MVRIRLRRVGAKKQPHYRVVVADQRSPRDGRHIETIGYYNPRTKPETVKIKEDRALYWLSQGAQPSDVVQRMLEKQGTMERFSRLKAGESLDALVSEYEADTGVTESAKPVSAEPVEQAAEVDVEAPEAEAQVVDAEAEATEAEAEETEAETASDEASDDEASEDEASEDEVSEEED